MEKSTMQIGLATTEDHGIYVLENYSGIPDDGVLQAHSLSLPEFDRVNYFSQDVRAQRGEWPAGANRVLPWVAGRDIAALFEESYVQDQAVRRPCRDGLFALFHLKGGDFLALLPLVGTETLAWLHVEDSGEITLRVGSLGTARVQGDVPLVAWARSSDLYAACHAAWEEAIAYGVSRGGTKWRQDKQYHEPFRYLGWCSWEQYKHNIDSALLTHAADAIHASDLPIRWMLVDDGHQVAEDRKLKSLTPDASKFPSGWQALLAKRKEAGLKWFGLWHCYFGLWNGIHPDNDLGPLNEDLVAKNDALFPGKDEAAAQRFYDALIGSVKAQGFDFVKIDVQATYLRMMRGKPNPVAMNTNTAQALETACEREMDGLINCMAHNSVCVCNTRYSAVTRCSIDYHLNDAPSAKSHLRQSYNNTLWLGQTVWPDHDMFHSSDPFCGRMMAVSKALSGGPVYLSDDPAQFREDYICPLIYEDGELLRPLAPAVPLPESTFADLLNEPVAYCVIAPLANGCAAVAVYNLMQTSSGDIIQAHITPNDYPHASGMLQPYEGPWTVPTAGLVIYDWYSGKGAKLDISYEVDLEGFSDRLLILSPISHGWAVIGRSDKYLSPAAVQSLVCTPGHCRITLVESGPLVVWLEEGTPDCEQAERVEALGNGFWRLSLPLGIREYIVMLRR